MLLRDPYFQLYLLHVAALFIIALWPRISQSQAQPEQQQAQPVANPVPEWPTFGPSSASPAMVRQWSLGARFGEVSRFQGLETAWRAECSTKYAHVLERITSA